MNQEVPVRICEGLGVQFPGTTRPIGSHDVTREPVRPGDGELRILLGTDGPALAGQVLAKDGTPVPDAIVVLVSQPGANDPSTLRITSTQRDQNGAYQFGGGISPASTSS
jgi:hypothetical protein